MAAGIHRWQDKILKIIKKWFCFKVVWRKMAAADISHHLAFISQELAKSDL